MNEAGKTAKRSASGWGWLAVAILLGFAVWQSGLIGKLRGGTETVNQAWFDNYSDRFLSETTVVRVSGKANQRPFPTAQGTTVIGSFPDGARISGRWVRGADPSILWFKAGDGIYLWEGPLAGDPAVIDRARRAALDSGKGGSAAPSDAAATAVAKAAAAPTAAASAAPSPAAPTKGLDAQTSAAVQRAIGDAVVAQDVMANAQVVSPVDQQGSVRLVWSMCADRCDFDYSSAVILSGSGARSQVQVCVHDSRRMTDESDWYAPGRSAIRRPGLCPSALAALE